MQVSGQLASSIEAYRAAKAVETLDPKSVMLERGIGAATPEEAMALNLSPGVQVAPRVQVSVQAD